MSVLASEQQVQITSLKDCPAYRLLVERIMAAVSKLPLVGMPVVLTQATLSDQRLRCEQPL